MTDECPTCGSGSPKHDWVLKKPVQIESKSREQIAPADRCMDLWHHAEWIRQDAEGERAEVAADAAPERTPMFDADELQLLTAAMAGNHPESLAHLRPGVVRKLAKLEAADAAPECCPTCGSRWPARETGPGNMCPDPFHNPTDPAAPSDFDRLYSIARWIDQGLAGGVKRHSQINDADFLRSLAANPTDPEDNRLDISGVEIPERSEIAARLRDIANWTEKVPAPPGFADFLHALARKFEVPDAC